MTDQIASMREAVRHAVDSIRQHTQLKPEIGLVLGSGLGGLANELEEAVAIPYEAIPGWPRSTVHGHSGRLVIGHLEGRIIVCQQGRAHFYEGYSLQQVTFPVRVMGALGISTLFLTNAAGGLDKAYRTGDLMLLNDHINLVGMSGNNPLMGPNDDSVGPRFLGMSQTYDRQLREIARQVAEESHIPMHTGCYACLSGPFFETPAEVRFLRAIGANAVGMSTVHEVLVARHMGLRVMAVSGITNEAIDEVDSERDTNHEEVLEAGMVIVPRLRALVRGVLRNFK